jgi:hypothetical protein
MVESGLLSRRGKQYVLLKKWDFNDNHRNSQKSVQRLAAVPPARTSSFGAPSSSSNGSGSRGVSAYAARSSG